MKIFDWSKQKSIDELQAELKALVMKVKVQQFPYTREMDRYEELLKQIYKMGKVPEITLGIEKKI